MILIPIICGLLYRMGGREQYQWLKWFNQKLWRSLGIPIFLEIIWLILHHASLVWWHELIRLAILIIMYYPICGIFPYGGGSYGRFFISGCIFGLSSFGVLDWFGIVQGIISGISYCIIKALDDRNIIKNPWVERLRGFCGTILTILI